MTAPSLILLFSDDTYGLHLVRSNDLPRDKLLPGDRFLRDNYHNY